MNALQSFNTQSDNLMTSENSINILVVDDDNDILHAIHDILELEDMNCNISIADNVPDAMKISSINPPDIAVIDIKIGTDNGLNLVPELKKLNPDVSCIMITAFRDTEYAITAIRFGAHDFIHKPVEPVKLIKTIGTLVANKKLKQERIQFERRFETIFEQSQNWLFVTSKSGHLINANQKALDAIEYDTDPIENMELWKTPWFTKSEIAQHILHNHINSTNMVSTSHNIELMMNNQLGYYELTLTPIINNKNNIDQFFIECRNITDQKEYEIKLNQFNTELEQKVKERTIELRQSINILENEIQNRKRAETELIEQKDKAEKASNAKSEFLSRMSHEFHTPLNAILGFGQLLELDTEQPLTESQKSNLHEIMFAGNNLLTMIDDILELSKMDKGDYILQLQPINIKDIVNSSLSSASTYLDGHDFNILNNTPDTEIYADTTAIKQVFDHILENSIKYNKNNGDITIDSYETDYNYLHVSITDSGPGINSDILENLFIPFDNLSTTMFDTESSGIGLTVVQNLMELMHGQVGVTSTPKGN
ncbi:MAG: response regulator, partial [Gammaproteobacteria bacterium]|nr:response regulator [Gammaproteobacteria bacterium]